MQKLPVNPDLGLLLIRIMVGIVGLYHGGQKLFGLFEGPGLQGTAKMFGDMHIPQPMAAAIMAGGSEFFGRLLVAPGLFSRIGGLFFAATMLTAVFLVHWPKFSGQGGMEYPLTLAVCLIAIVVGGPGKYSITRAV
jgi:putative oxidoreductase